MRIHRVTVLPIRIWMGFALLAVILLPLAAMAIVTMLALQGVFAQTSDYERLRINIAQDAGRWNDPAWQAELARQIAPTKVHVTLSDANGQIVFQDRPPGQAESAFPDGVPLSPSRTDDPTTVTTVAQRFTRFTVTQGGQRIGTALITVGDGDVLEPRAYHLKPFDFVLFQLTGPLRVPIAFTGLITFLIITLIVAWFLGRALLRPLAALDIAARRVAVGDLDFDVPTSRIREVAAVGTAFRAMGGALRESLYRQAEVEGERRIFITAIVHDLRTPLFSLRGYLEGLVAGIARSPRQVAEYLDVCCEKVAVLDRLVADLFTYARMEYLEQSPERTPLELGALLQRAAEGMRPLCAERNITLTLTQPDVECPFTGDGHMLTRAVENLLDNAIRHTPAGGTVHIEWHETADDLRFSVADSGPGIPPGDLPHLFAPMYRGESSRNRQTGGAGLGLTIARRVLVAHGGDLIAANQQGSGAIFTAILPPSENPPESWDELPMRETGHLTIPDPARLRA